MNRTPRGITIDRSEESQNAFDSIRVNREFDSNEIDLQSEKHDQKRNSTLDRITIDQNDDEIFPPERIKYHSQRKDVLT
jgi:hypothetical protein